MVASINRPARRWNSIARHARMRLSRLGSLLSSAGLVDRPEFEALEPRKLLFALTITPEMVGTNPFEVGTIRAYFGYAIPYLGPSAEPTDADPTEVEEDFSSAAPPPPGVVPQTFTWASGFTVRHNLAVAPPALAGMRLVEETLDPSGDNEVLVSIQGGGEFTFSLLEFNVPMTFFQITLRGQFNAGNFTVELLNDGIILESLTGQALDVLGVPPAGEERIFTFLPPAGSTSFDQVRFVANPGAPSMQFRYDNLSAVIPGRRFDAILEPRLWGAEVRFTGPVGATVEFFDLYDRPMRQTIAVGEPPQTLFPFLLIDPDGDGIPNFNDGIGRIVITNPNGETQHLNPRISLTMWGGELGAAQTPPANVDFFENGFWFRLPGNFMGFYDDFQQAGFGFAARPDDAVWDVTGLPTGVGTLIIGSPFVRPLNNYNVTGLAPGAGTTVISGFNNPNQGIFTEGLNGAPMSVSTIYLDAMLFGSSRFTGFVDHINLGTLYGSISVAGDLGTLQVASDSGLWIDDEGIAPNGARAVGTGSQLVVERTLGQFIVGGRNMTSVTVVGDIDSPGTRPPRDFFRYIEREHTTGLPLDAPIRDAIRDILNRNDSAARNDFLSGFGQVFTRIDQVKQLGLGFGGNNTILTAEWVGNAGTAVEIYGALGFRGVEMPLFDPSDVYGFAVDGSQDVVIELDSLPGVYMRVVDARGRTIAASNLDDIARPIVTLRFRPEMPGVYFLVLHTSVTPAPSAVPHQYLAKITGMAPTTLGSYRVGASSGNIPLTALSNTINVLRGSVGSIVVDSGFLMGSGALGDVNDIVNAGAEDAPPARGLRGGTISIPGNLYGLLVGWEIFGGVALRAELNVGGHIGVIHTGLLFGGSAWGNIRNALFNVGGSIAYIDVPGAIGTNQNPGVDRPWGTDVATSVIFRTGQDPQNLGLRGDIGFIRVGSHIGGDTLAVHTSAGSIVGGLAVSQDRLDEEELEDFGIYGFGGLAHGVQFNLGANSDMRFFDTPRMDLFQIVNHSIPIPGPGQQPLELTDDAGGRVRISITGGGGLASGSVRMLPLNHNMSQGVAIGRLTVDLANGAILRIESAGQAPVGNQHVVSIGRINIRGASANSAIRITGPVQVDVWQIVQEDGDAFNEIVNTTPRGDIVAADVVGLNRLEIGTGSLGRTQVPAWGPDVIGPYLGIEDSSGGGSPGEPLPLDPAAITPFWNTITPNVFRPVNESRFIRPTPNSWLDDVGSPFDPYLNGLMVREGDITLVQVGGAVGDVFAPEGVINNVIANADAVTPHGEFHGIVGNIHALRIARVDIGDGLAPPGPGPMATTGITALDDINLVIGTRIPGANIESNIIAANINAGNATPTTFPTDGIHRIELRGGGDFIGAWIGATPLDNFWWSYMSPDDGAYTGTVNEVRGFDANFLRSRVQAFTMNTMVLTNGFYDASVVHIAQNVQRIEAAGYRNSTIGGNAREHFENRITVANDLNIITTTGRQGDMNDLHLQVHRRASEISARNITRSTLDVNVEILNLTAVLDLRSSEVSTGMLTSATIGQNIRSSRLMVAGPLVSLTVGDSITNTEISVTGPDGRIDSITVTNLLSGRISSTGPIDRIRVTEGDMVAFIQTVRSQHGNPSNINLLSAGRDLDIRTDVAGTINQLVAGRHIGNRADPGIILVRGDIQTVSVPNGQLYSDLRVGGNVQTTTIGRVVNLPGNSIQGAGSIIAFGRIERVTIEGDFGGDIISYSGGIGLITINNGSFLPGARIAAYDGVLSNLVINSGNLYGDVHADYHILSIRLNGSADGVFGHIGINHNFSAGTPYSEHRNQHPPGVIAMPGIQGPRITAGHNLGRVILTNGSIYESFLYAKRAIGTIEVGGNVRNDPLTPNKDGTVIAAGSSIHVVRIFGNVSNTMIFAGIRSFGDDGRPGGILEGDRDEVQSGRINLVDIRGSATDVVISAGVGHGADGMYNTPADLVMMGVSYVNTVNVGGTVTNVHVNTDSSMLNATPGIILRSAAHLAQADADIHLGAPVGDEIVAGAAVFSFTSPNGETGSITFSGPGRAFWDQAGNRIILFDTTLASELTVTSSTGRLTDFAIVTNNNGSMGRLFVDANLFGDSRIVLDGYVLQVETRDLNDQSTIRIGMNVRNITTGNINGGSIDALYWARDININGNFGTPALFDEADISVVAANSITITGNNAARINVERDLGSFVVTGDMARAQFRSGASVNSFTAGSLSETRISVRDNLGPVVVNGRVFDTTIQAGGDLGEHVTPGVGNNTTTGNIASVVVSGDFERSSIVAGLLRGPDGFFGTGDDLSAPGLSTIGPVTISGIAKGSNSNSQQYRISAAGSVGNVTISGQPGVNQGNFQIRTLENSPAPIQVLDVHAISEAQTWTAWIYFNQVMNESTIGPALTISEVRRDDENLLTQIFLTEGVHYRLTDYDPVQNRIGVVFDRSVTGRNLDDETGLPGDLPGPGVYRFELDADILRGTIVTARLAGDRGGFGNSSRDFSQDVIVGDAGDKLEPSIVLDQFGRRIDFYGPVDLNLVLDNNYEPDGLPDPNTPVIIRGTIGDHPDHGVSSFQAPGDSDIYQITLRAGQILRLGAMEGPARFATRLLLNEAGEFQGGVTPESVQLPTDPFDLFDLTQEEHFLIKETGTYFIAVTAHFGFFDPEFIPNILPGAGTLGQYRFTLEVYDDGNSGFSADTDSGNGEPIVNAPAPIVFAGPSGVFGTADDRSEIIIGDFVFRLDPGPDGIPGTADDIVTGSNGNGIVSTRMGNTLTSVVDAAIGPRGHAGVPGAAVPDVDIYHLNNRQPIAPGQLITVTVKLSDIGADLGSFSPRTFFDFRGDVQFAIFDTTHSEAIDDALLVFSPSDFLPIAGEAREIAKQGQPGYGFDENGDFFISFITPGRIDGLATQDATYAIYLQGVFNTDYRLEIVQTDAPQNLTVPRGVHNILLETKGGEIDWLEVGGLTTELSGFNASVLGFVGTFDNIPVSKYIVDGVIANLQNIFTLAGVRVNISSNPIDFEFQDFSKIFITSTTDPITAFNINNFGYSERSDPFNFDRNDESVIFVPSFGTLGYTGARADVENFIHSLTAAVGRRIGELAGLRVTDTEFFGDPRDIMSANSVFVAPPFLGTNYAFTDQARPLSSSFDLLSNTNFFLGHQNSLALLQRFILPL